MSCRVARCGDGVRRLDIQEGGLGYEACDDGNANQTDACLTTCVAAACGDGLLRRDLQPGEEGYEGCDDGNLANNDGCDSDCQVELCGNGQVDPGEDCDGEPLEHRRLHQRLHQRSVRGRHHRVDLQEVIKVTSVATATQRRPACTNSCTRARCGDGVARRTSRRVKGYEACDDGNQSQTDACLNNCVVASCGDGHQRAGQRARRRRL